MKDNNDLKYLESLFLLMKKHNVDSLEVEGIKISKTNEPKQKRNRQKKQPVLSAAPTSYKESIEDHDEFSKFQSMSPDEQSAYLQSQLSVNGYN